MSFFNNREIPRPRKRKAMLRAIDSSPHNEAT
jgi:hypothetical protein